ncbi:hypothetical protein PO124_23000 [Bacillus licheniformis]|nr:hypothetical protein [Bacillus licheniformis]
MVVAPSQTLTDADYQMLRSASLKSFPRSMSSAAATFNSPWTRRAKLLCHRGQSESKPFISPRLKATGYPIAKWRQNWLSATRLPS